jgi:hypothetical protein
MPISSVSDTESTTSVRRPSDERIIVWCAWSLVPVDYDGVKSSDAQVHSFFFGSFGTTGPRRRTSPGKASPLARPPLRHHNPLCGRLTRDRQKRPGSQCRRPGLESGQYTALLAGMSDLHPLFLALELAHETGHRIGVIRLLRWSDVDTARRLVRWRGENDKIDMSARPH